MTETNTDDRDMALFMVDHYNTEYQLYKEYMCM